MKQLLQNLSQAAHAISCLQDNAPEQWEPESDWNQIAMAGKHIQAAITQGMALDANLSPVESETAEMQGNTPADVLAAMCGTLRVLIDTGDLELPLTKWDDLESLITKGTQALETHNPKSILGEEPEEDTTAETANAIAEACQNAFSYDRWGSVAFQSIAANMLDLGFRSDQIIGVLHHRCMRHAADNKATQAEEDSGIIPARKFFEYMGQSLTDDFANTAIFHGQPTITKEG